MIFRAADFKGQIPRLNARLLPINYAQVANNTRLQDGAIGPMKQPVTSHTFGATPETFIKYADVFTAFDQPNVSAVIGPVAQDRLYYTGNAFPKVRIAGTDYNLGVNAPTAPPSIAVTTDAVGNAAALATLYVIPPDPLYVPEEFGYRYSAVTPRGETSGSPASTPILRQDGERVVLSGMVLPADTTKIRIYRVTAVSVYTSAGAAGRHGLLEEVTYDVAIHGPVGAATYTDTFTYFPDLTQTPIEEGQFASSDEVVTYVYTYVTQFDEESAPSPPSALSTISKGSTVDYSVTAPTQTDRGINRIRVYRSKTSINGITDYYFRAEHGSSSGGYADDLKALLNEPITCTDYAVPEPTMLGLISLPNGLMAAHAKRELLFSEPFIPHAWPYKYRLTTDSDIVGLGAFGTYVIVLTKGSPYLVQGNDPSLLIMEKMEKNLPCVASKSIVDMGYSVAFATHEGLVEVSQNGAQVVTRSLFTEEQWRALRPSTFIANQINGRYVFSYLPVDGQPRKFGIIDMSGAQPYYMECDISPTVMYFDPPDGVLYYIEGDAVVKQFDPMNGATIMKQTWRGKRTVLQGYDNFGAILVETDPLQGTKANGADPDCEIKVYADGVLIHTLTEVNVAARLPSGFLASTWEVEIVGYLPVTAVSIATDIYELAEG